MDKSLVWVIVISSIHLDTEFIGVSSSIDLAKDKIEQGIKIIAQRIECPISIYRDGELAEFTDNTISFTNCNYRASAILCEVDLNESGD